MRTPLALAGVLVALLAHVAAAYAAPSVQIRRTEHGYPHIRAHSWTGLGYGYRIRVVARTSRGRTIRHDRRARTCTPAIKR